MSEEFAQICNNTSPWQKCASSASFGKRHRLQFLLVYGPAIQIASSNNASPTDTVIVRLSGWICPPRIPSRLAAFADSASLAQRRPECEENNPLGQQTKSRPAPLYHWPEHQKPPASSRTVAESGSRPDDDQNNPLFIPTVCCLQVLAGLLAGRYRATGHPPITRAPPRAPNPFNNRRRGGSLTAACFFSFMISQSANAAEQRQVFSQRSHRPFQSLAIRITQFLIAFNLS